VSYRDDVDTLYSRALVLQRELDDAQRRLEQREAEIAELKGEARPPRADTSPGIRELRTLPDPHAALDRLVDSSDKRGRDHHLTPIPMPDWGHIVGKATPTPSVLVERMRDRVAMLTPEDLLLVAKIVDELTDVRGSDEELRKRLRWLASELALRDVP
jgi:hypothetical protein